MEQQVRKRPALFRALGKDDPPAEVTIRGVPYRREAIYKHDSWAATSVYINDAGERAICKFNRRQPVFIVPMGWLGRALAAREAAFLNRLADTGCVPEDLGPVSANGRMLPYAMARVFIEGVAFRSPDQVDEAFFEALRDGLTRIHEHDVAYVDLHKRENILIAADGRPVFLDFQVSYGLRKSWLGGGPVSRYVLRQLQELDDYHYLKHVSKCCPDMIPDADRYLQRTGLVRLHRRIARPFKYLRKKLLIGLRIRDASGRVETELEPEIAFRREGRAAGPERDDSGIGSSDRPTAGAA